MKNLKKIGALLLALVMVLATATAFGTAATADMKGDGTEDGVLGEFTAADIPTVYGNTVKLYKELTVFNENETSVNAPAITYNYSIALGASGAQVKDAGGTSLHSSGSAVEVQTKAGITGATISNVTLDTTTQLTASATGSKNVFPITVDFSGVTWTAAGVYRYVITEHVNSKTSETDDTAEKNAAGIADGSILNVRYLDVYVKDGSTAGTYEIYGYVCFQNLGAIDGTTTSTVTAAAKTEGFVSDLESDGSTTLTADQYYTFNLTVSKTLVGDQAMNGHDFPFYVNFLNSSVTANVSIIKRAIEDGTPAADASMTAAKLSATTNNTLTGIADNPGIDHGSSVKYIGIPVGITAATTATVYETNNVIGTTYSSLYGINGTDDSNSSKTISWDSTNDANKSNVASWNSVTKNTATGNSDVFSVDFTNTLLLISPTGYVARIAPYALMLAAGITLLVIFLKRRKPATEDEE